MVAELLPLSQAEYASPGGDFLPTGPTPVQRFMDRTRLAMGQIGIELSPTEKQALLTYWTFYAAPTPDSEVVSEDSVDRHNRVDVASQLLHMRPAKVRTFLNYVSESDKLIDAFEKLEGKIDAMANLDDLAPFEVQRIELKEQGLTYAQIGEIQGVSVQTVKNFFSKRRLTR